MKEQYCILSNVHLCRAKPHEYAKATGKHSSEQYLYTSEDRQNSSVISQIYDGAFMSLTSEISTSSPRTNPLRIQEMRTTNVCHVPSCSTSCPLAGWHKNLARQNWTNINQPTKLYQNASCVISTSIFAGLYRLLNKIDIAHYTGECPVKWWMFQ